MSNTATSTINKTIYSFGTSGYRNDTDAGFNPQIVRQITEAIADTLILQMQQEGKAKPVLVGGDTREKTAMALPIVVETLLSRGLDVYQTEGDVATPILAYAAANLQKLFPEAGPSAGAVLLTASHNPWPYGGFNFLTPDGAVAPSPISKQFEAFQAEPRQLTLDRAAYGLEQAAKVTLFDPYPAYEAHLSEELKLDWQAMREAQIKVAYDALYATGRKPFPKLLEKAGLEAELLHCTEQRPEGYAGMPEPSPELLEDLSNRVKATSHAKRLVVGLSNDGDADRFGVLDENGNYLHPNTVLGLLLFHGVKNLGWKQGIVVRSQATSHQLDALADQYGLSIEQTPVGYKYIAETFLEATPEHPVLLGGESSGGCSVYRHIPEKDGLLINLLILELMAKTQKPLTQLQQELENTVGRGFCFREWTVRTEAKAELVAAFKAIARDGKAIGPFQTDSALTEARGQALEKTYGTRDGVKLYDANNQWILVRASGTEPILRVYWETQATSKEGAQTISNSVETALKALLAEHGVTEAAIKVKA